MSLPRKYMDRAIAIARNADQCQEIEDLVSDAILDTERSKDDEFTQDLKRVIGRYAPNAG